MANPTPGDYLGIGLRCFSKQSLAVGVPKVLLRVLASWDVPGALLAGSFHSNVLYWVIPTIKNKTSTIHLLMQLLHISRGTDREPLKERIGKI